MTTMSFSSILTRSLLVASVLLGIGAGTAAGQTQRDEQFYFPGRFNWQFLANYPEAARLFNAFDYGHAVLYERLYTKRGKAVPELEKEYRYLTTDLLIRPPKFAVAEEVVMPAYAKLAWRAKMMFDWAHILHRQVYDAYADERLISAQRDILIEQLTDYYLSNRKYAFTDKPKSMALMDEQYFSQTFRKAYPDFNGLIWAYHWLQVGLYEPYIEGQTKAERKAGVQATLARFWSMLEDPPGRMPKVMPMTSAVAPKFSAAHPRAAVIFDNLHMMHDIISDILTGDTIPHEQKGRMIDEQLDKLQDPTRDTMSLDEWKMMADHMGGVEVMGGRATELVKLVQAMPGMTPDSAPMAHDMDQMGQPMKGMPHDSMSASMGAHVSAMTALHERMMADPVIRRRIMADSLMRGLMAQMMDSAEAAGKPGARKPSGAKKHEGHGEEMKKPGGRKPPRAKPPAPAPRPAKPDSSAMPSHDQHSAGAADGSRRGT
jgi:hypothetical protein